MRPEAGIAAHLWDMCETLRMVAKYVEGRERGELITDSMLERLLDEVQRAGSQSDTSS